MSKIISLVNNHLTKDNKKSIGKTLAHYDDNLLIPGGDSGLYYTHINYHTIKQALIELNKLNQDYYNFVETGCSAHGTQSTLLWDKFVNLFNGEVISIDINQEAVDKTNKLTSNKTKLICSNSLDYLPKINKPIDFLYLDSYDVNFLDPSKSAWHHLKEFHCIKKRLHSGSIVLIDDTPLNPEWLDDGKNNIIYNKFKKQFNPDLNGKGSLVNKELEKMGATKIMHQYQCLWKIN